MCVLMFSKTFVWNIFRSKTYTGLHVKYPLFFSDFNEHWILSADYMKIRPQGAEMFHTDRQADGETDRQDKLNSRFSQFCERS
jgi:hypothetical protein